MAAHFGNLYALGNTGGRPPHYASASDLEKKIQEYFEHVDTENEQEEGEVPHYEPPTITGLCLFCGFSSLQSLFDQDKRGEEFSEVIKRAKQVIMKVHELRLGGTTPTGSIFWLKNFGWKDTQSIDHTNNGNSFNTLTDAELITKLNQLLESREKD